MVLQSLDRGLDALNILAKHDLVSVTELAKELEVDKSTASRIMETLRQHDMVQPVSYTHLTLPTILRV